MIKYSGMAKRMAVNTKNKTTRSKKTAKRIAIKYAAKTERMTKSKGKKK